MPSSVWTDKMRLVGRDREKATDQRRGQNRPIVRLGGRACHYIVCVYQEGMSNQRLVIVSENDGNAPIDLVDDNLAKGFFAMFCLDSLDLEKSDSKVEGLLATESRVGGRC